MFDALATIVRAHGRKMRAGEEGAHQLDSDDIRFLGKPLETCSLKAIDVKSLGGGIATVGFETW